MAIMLFDKLTADCSEKYTMSIRLRPGGLSFSAYNRSVHDAFFYKELELDRSKPYVRALEDCFFECPFLTWAYKRIQVVCETSQYTIVPKEIFEEERKRELLSFAFTNPQGRCLHNELEALQAVVVFGMDEEVYAFCSRSLVAPRFIHHLTALLPLWKKQSQTRLPKQLYVTLYPRRMDIACYAQGNLLFVNSFNFESPDDVLYYILYVWKQAGMDQQKDQLRLFGEMSLRVALTETLRNYLQYVDLQEIPSEAYLLGSEILQAPLDLIALSVCES